MVEVLLKWRRLFWSERVGPQETKARAKSSSEETLLKEEGASDRSQMQIMQGRLRKGRCLRPLPRSLSPRQHEFCLPGNWVFSSGSFKFCSFLAFLDSYSDSFCLSLLVPGRWHYHATWARRQAPFAALWKEALTTCLSWWEEAGQEGLCEPRSSCSHQDAVCIFLKMDSMNILPEENDCIHSTLHIEQAKVNLSKQNKMHFKCLHRYIHNTVPTSQCWT